jgi:hypothetical protein
MIAQQKDVEGSNLIAHVRREEARRRTAGTLIEPLPTTLQLAEDQITDWGPRWKKATRGAPVTFEAAQAVAAAFLTPVLDGTADGMRWNAAAQSWA